ncbi:MAG TPA: MBL fold metallo-hydrolase [Desulfatiglandales bacterium]|nr:MBL fold metallo-hydrolase [Desulfatiglandales bacterium]
MAQPAVLKRIIIGEIRVTYIPDGHARLDKCALFPSSTPEGWSLHQEWLDGNGRLVASIGSFLIETKKLNIMVDMGYGDRLLDIPGYGTFVAGRLLDNLATVGIRPTDIDIVVYTHLHRDHIGWTSHLVESSRKLTFPNAAYLLSSVEWDFWRGPDVEIGPSLKEVREPLEDRAKFVVDGQVIAPGVSVMATPGHTPGHLAVIVSSEGRRAIILGDIVHCPVQFHMTDWNMLYDVAPDLSIRTRQQFIKDFSDDDTIIAGGHFGNVVFGQLITKHGKPRWRTLE